MLRGGGSVQLEARDAKLSGLLLREVEEETADTFAPAAGGDRQLIQVQKGLLTGGLAGLKRDRSRDGVAEHLGQLMVGPVDQGPEDPDVAVSGQTQGEVRYTVRQFPECHPPPPSAPPSARGQERRKRVLSV